jgi:hypothetical protein
MVWSGRIYIYIYIFIYTQCIWLELVNNDGYGVSLTGKRVRALGDWKACYDKLIRWDVS